LERRLGACLRALRVGSEAEGQARLLADPDSCGAALNALLIGVSEFFRDSAVFDTLARVVVPALAQLPGGIRVWSLGCSTGAELYSVAILLAEAGLVERSSLVGTDCRAQAVASAEAATFPEEAIERLDGGVRSRYLERTTRGWRVAERVRRVTSWRTGDATREVIEGPWNLVLCRNLLMYLHQAVAETLVRGVVERLAPGGFLMLGKAERPPASLRLVAVDRCIYQAPCQ
jgi:chemotaxis methyl-accepting protein methylase